MSAAIHKYELNEARSSLRALMWLLLQAWRICSFSRRRQLALKSVQCSSADRDLGAFVQGYNQHEDGMPQQQYASPLSAGSHAPQAPVSPPSDAPGNGVSEDAQKERRRRFKEFKDSQPPVQPCPALHRSNANWGLHDPDSDPPWQTDCAGILSSRCTHSSAPSVNKTAKAVCQV